LRPVLGLDRTPQRLSGGHALRRQHRLLRSDADRAGASRCRRSRREAQFLALDLPDARLPPLHLRREPRLFLRRPPHRAVRLPPLHAALSFLLLPPPRAWSRTLGAAGLARRRLCVLPRVDRLQLAWRWR